MNIQTIKVVGRIRSLLFWTLLIVAIEFVFYASEYRGHLAIFHRWSSVVAMFLRAFVASLSGVLHYHFIFVRFFRRKKYVQYAMLVLLLIFLIGIINWLIGFINYPEDTLQASVKLQLSMMSVRVVAYYFPFALLYGIVQGIRTTKERKKTLVHEQRTASLRLLKSKLEPHFLFNTLNAIYAIAQKERADGIIASIDSLSDRIRSMLEGDRVRPEGNDNVVPITNTELLVPRYEAIRHFFFWWVSLTGFVSWGTAQEASILSEPGRYFIFIPSIMAVLSVTIVSHYYLLFRPYIATGRYLMYALFSILFWAVAIGLDAALGYVVSSMGVLNGTTGIWPLNLFKSTQRVAAVGAILAIFYAVVQHYRVLKKERRVLEQANKEKDLQLLRSNVDTEYLFDALNELQSVAKQADAPATQAAVQQLTDLFRYSSEQANKETVPVQDEMAFIRQYLDLQKMRIQQSDGVKIESSITWDEQPSEIAPMLLLPFVENAFKFGISYEQPSEISIDIRFENKRMECHVVNTDHSQLKQFQSSGMGIANTVKRLELQYEGRYELEYGAENGIYTVHLRVDLSR